MRENLWPTTGCPEACTLPTVEQPLRRDEFDALFSEDVISVQQVSAERLRFGLRAHPEAAARAAGLAVKETGCCSFFTFDLSIGDGMVSMTVSTGPASRGSPGRARGTGSGTSGRQSMSGALRAGQVADAVGINIETLRYYERRGIIPAPDRSPGGHRVYDDDTVTILRVIKAAQRLGFSLDEVAELLEAGRHRHGAGPRGCRPARRPSSSRSTRRSPTSR